MLSTPPATGPISVADGGECSAHEPHAGLRLDQRAIRGGRRGWWPQSRRMRTLYGQCHTQSGQPLRCPVVYTRAPIGVMCTARLQGFGFQVTHPVRERHSLLSMSRRCFGLSRRAEYARLCRWDGSGTLLSVNFLDGERFLHSRPCQHSVVMSREWRGADARSKSPVDAEEMLYRRLRLCRSRRCRSPNFRFAPTKAPQPQSARPLSVRSTGPLPLGNELVRGTAFQSERYCVASELDDAEK